jgi:hypothetical protein
MLDFEYEYIYQMFFVFPFFIIIEEEKYNWHYLDESFFPGWEETLTAFI